MTAIYGHRWTSAHGDDPQLANPAGPGRTWQVGLAGFSPPEIRAGLARCLDRDGDGWPPTLPEFRALCGPQPQDYGVPDVEDAFAEAAQRAHPCAPAQDWSHPTVIAAYRRMGRDRLLLERREARRIFGKVWDEVVRAYLAGELAEAETALPSPRTTSAPAPRAEPGTVRRHLAQARALLGGNRETDRG